MSTTDEKKLPSKEDVIKFYKEQIEIAKLRKDLAEQVCATAEFDARTAEAIAKKAHFSAPMPQQSQSMPEGVVEHVVTQEDLDNNPELAEQGIKVGDVVGIAEKPSPVEEEEDAPEERPVRQLKKD
jgi:hypothetical protein